MSSILIYFSANQPQIHPSYWKYNNTKNKQTTSSVSTYQWVPELTEWSCELLHQTCSAGWWSLEGLAGFGPLEGVLPTTHTHTHTRTLMRKATTTNQTQLFTNYLMFQYSLHLNNQRVEQKSLIAPLPPPLPPSPSTYPSSHPSPPSTHSG